MRFLVPSGSSLPPDSFGVLTTPAHRNIPKAIEAGALWAADNQAFTVGFNPDVFFPWLESMRPYRNRCLFVTVPDSVGNAIETLHLWRNWAWQFYGWSLAFAAQDGQESLPLPNHFDALFVGGSTRWKESQGAIDCIRRAQRQGAHIHIGRVNWQRRYNMFRILNGSEDFTCDGTRTRFDGLDKTITAWRGYQAQPPLITI